MVLMLGVDFGKLYKVIQNLCMMLDVLDKKLSIIGKFYLRLLYMNSLEDQYLDISFINTTTYSAKTT